jgi:hypothetical protein
LYCSSKITFQVCTSTAPNGSCRASQNYDFVVLEQNTVCTASQIQLTTASEFSLATASPWTLSQSEGAAIAGAILLVWAIGFSFKALISALGGGSPEHN